MLEPASSDHPVRLHLVLTCPEGGPTVYGWSRENTSAYWYAGRLSQTLHGVLDREADLPWEGRVLPRRVWFLLDLGVSISLLYFFGCRNLQLGWLSWFWRETHEDFINTLIKSRLQLCKKPRGRKLSRHTQSPHLGWNNSYKFGELKAGLLNWTVKNLLSWKPAILHNQ